MLVRQDHVRLFELGAHPFLTLTLFIAMFDATTGRWSTRSPTVRRWPPVAPLPGHRDVKAAVVTAHGEPASYADHPDPNPADGQVLVRITAAPVVPLDLLCASGTSYFGQPALPYVPGVQGVGVTDDGRRVWVASSAGMRPGDGTLAEQYAVTPTDIVPISGDVEDAALAAIGLSGVAAWSAVHLRARLLEGERVAVLAPAGPSARSPSRWPSLTVPAASSGCAEAPRPRIERGATAPTRSSRCPRTATWMRSPPRSPTRSAARRTSSSTRCSGGSSRQPSGP